MPHKELSAKQKKRLLAILIPLVKIVAQKIMARSQRRANANPNTGMDINDAAHSGRPTQEPVWTWSYFLNPHTYVQRLAAFLLPISLGSLNLYEPVANPRKQYKGVAQLPAFIIDFTKYEIDHQLRLGVPNLRRRHKHRRPKTQLNGFLNRSEKYYDFVEELIAHEVEKEIRDHVRAHVKTHGAPPAFPDATQPRTVDGGEHAIPGEPPQVAQEPPRPHLRFSDLNAEQREFLVAALTERLSILVDNSPAEILEKIERQGGNLWGIGYDDLMQRTLDRNFDLNDVRWNASPQASTNRQVPGSNLEDHPASTYGPFGISSTTGSSSTAQTQWPTPRRLGYGTPSPDGDRSDNNIKTPSSTPRLKQAEPSIRRVFGALGSLRKKKQPPRNASATQTVVPGDIPKQDPILEDHRSNSRDERPQPGSTQESRRRVSMRRPHHTSLIGALREALAPPTHSAAASNAPSPKPPLIRQTRRPAQRLSEKSGNKQDPKGKEPAEGNKKSSTSQSIVNLLRRDPIAEAKSRREEAEDKAKGNFQQESKDRSKGKGPTPEHPAGATPLAIDSSAPIGLGISYEEMAEATPPTRQQETRPAAPVARPPSIPPQEIDRNVGRSTRGPVSKGSAMPDPIPQSQKQGPGASAAGPPKVASALGGRPSRVPPSAVAGPSRSQQPQVGRLGKSSVQIPASATAPAKVLLGTRLLDRLEAAKKQDEAVLENGPGPAIEDQHTVPIQNNVTSGSTNGKSSSSKVVAKVSRGLGKASAVAFASSPPKVVEGKSAPSDKKSTAAAVQPPSKPEEITVPASIPIPGFDLLPQTTYVPSTKKASAPAAPTAAASPTLAPLFSKKSTKKKPQQTTPNHEPPAPKQVSPVSPYVSDGSKYGSEGKNNDDVDLPKWSWPSNLPADKKEDNPRNAPFGGGGGGWKFGNV